MAREFAAAGPMAKLCTVELAPGPGVRTDAELRELIRRDLGTMYHPVGTCAMGGDSRLAASKLTSVVDPELRVRGIEGLRVVDASVMPTVPAGQHQRPDHRHRRARRRPDLRPCAAGPGRPGPGPEPDTAGQYS